MKMLVAYDSRSGHTEKMAEYMAEAGRVAGVEVDVKKISEIKNEAGLAGYDAYLFGSPTYHRDMTQGMKTFLFLVQKANLAGKAGGAFGSYTHSGDAPKLIFDTLECVFKMNVTDLGSFNLLEDRVHSGEGVKACHDYAHGVLSKCKK